MERTFFSSFEGCITFFIESAVVKAYLFIVSLLLKTPKMCVYLRIQISNKRFALTICFTYVYKTLIYVMCYFNILWFSFFYLYSKENESTKGELSIQRMKALFESQRALDIERKLFANERCLQVSQSENMKLRAKLDELKLKYEPEGMYVSYILSFKLRETEKSYQVFFFFSYYSFMQIPLQTNLWLCISI